MFTGPVFAKGRFSRDVGHLQLFFSLKSMLMEIHGFFGRFSS